MVTAYGNIRPIAGPSTSMSPKAQHASCAQNVGLSGGKKGPGLNCLSVDASDCTRRWTNATCALGFPSPRIVGPIPHCSNVNCKGLNV